MNNSQQWVDVWGIDLPPRDPKFENLSVDLEIMKSDGVIVLGFYDFRLDEYFEYKQGRCQRLNFLKLIKWRLTK